MSRELLETIEARLFTMGVGSSVSLRTTLRRNPSDVKPVPPETGLEIEATIGEGGMGVVLLATQKSIGRKVAVKTLRQSDPGAIVRLVREGKLTGALEHPNIVPIHDIVTGADGLPQLVLKRIEGTTWLDRMNDEEGVRRIYGARDLLEWNLQTLAQVCQAVHFAHSRGVVHRDLKPENVMVGNFGEVYVVDWGIAVQANEPMGLEREGGIVGTPVYMAPEMLVDEPVDARTDVYLIGAVLFELLAGRPPHAHASVRQVIDSVLATPPPMPTSAPEELVTLARACLSRDRADRPQTAEDVRRAIAAFLRHRDSAALASRAESKFDELAAAIVEEPSAARIPALYGECVFGYRAALEAWPENAVAKRGLDRAVRRVIEHELASGSERTAEMRLADLPTPDPELTKRVSDAVLRARKKEVALHKLEQELDPATGRRIRIRTAWVVMGMFVLASLIDSAFVVGTPLETHLYFVAQAVVEATVVGSIVLVYWKHLRGSQLNRRLAAAVLFCLLAQATGHLGAQLAGFGLRETETALFFLWFTIVGMVSAVLIHNMWPSAIAFLGAFFVCAIDPSRRYTAGIVTNVILLANAILAWRAPTRREPEP